MKVSELIKLLEPYNEYDVRTFLELEVAEEEIQKRMYKYPHYLYEIELYLADVGHSDKEILLEAKIK